MSTPRCPGCGRFAPSETHSPKLHAPGCSLIHGRKVKAIKKPRRCEAEITEGPRRGQVCGSIGKDGHTLTPIISYGKRVIGWQCKRGHVTGKYQ